MILMGQFQLKIFYDAKIMAGSLSWMTFLPLEHQNMAPPQGPRSSAQGPPQGNISGQPPHSAPWVE